MSKEGTLSAKEEARAILAVTSGVTPKSFLLLVEGTMRPSLDDAFANLSPNSSRLFYQRPTSKNTKKCTHQNHN